MASTSRYAWAWVKQIEAPDTEGERYPDVRKTPTKVLTVAFE
jgi:hypothetical protein